MAAIQFDKRQYAGVVRTICAGECKDSRITAMWIDEQANVPMTPPYMNWPISVLVQESSPWMIGDERDRLERDRLGGAGVAYARVNTEQWTTDYPGDAHREEPQGLSLLAAAMVAARRAAGVANGSG